MKKSLVSVLALTLLVATVSNFAEAAPSSKKKIGKRSVQQSRKYQAKRKAMPKRTKSVKKAEVDY